MSAFTATDEIRARGMRVSLDSCEGCREARKMDDLNQIALDRLERAQAKLGAFATEMRKSRDLWRLVACAIGFVALLLLLGDLGVFKP